MEPKRISRPGSAQDSSHIPTLPFGRKGGAASSPPAAGGSGESPSEKSHPFRFVISQSNIAAALSSHKPHATQLEQPLHAGRQHLSAWARRISPGAKSRPTDAAIRAPRRLSHWALFGALLLGAFALMCWLVAPNDAASRSVSSTTAFNGSPLGASTAVAPTNGDGAHHGQKPDFPNPGSGPASERAARPENVASQRVASPQPLAIRSPTAALQRQAASTPRASASEASATLKKHSLLNSVLAPRPD